jgi:hypothetical protein
MTMRARPGVPLLAALQPAAVAATAEDAPDAEATPLAAAVVSVAIALRPQSAGARLSPGTGILLTAMRFHLGVTALLPPLGSVTLADEVMV